VVREFARLQVVPHILHNVPDHFLRHSVPQNRKTIATDTLNNWAVLISAATQNPFLQGLFSPIGHFGPHPKRGVPFPTRSTMASDSSGVDVVKTINQSVLRGRNSQPSSPAKMAPISFPFRVVHVGELPERTGFLYG